MKMRKTSSPGPFSFEEKGGTDQTPYSKTLSPRERVRGSAGEGITQ